MCLLVFSILIGYWDNCMGCVKILREECEVNICMYMCLICILINKCKFKIFVF